MTAARTAHPMPVTEAVDGAGVHPLDQPVVAGATLPLPICPERAAGAASAAAEPQAAAQGRCSVRPAPRREPAFDDEPFERHLRLVRASMTPQLPFPPTPRTADPSPRRLTLVPDPVRQAPAAAAGTTIAAGTAPAPAALFTAPDRPGPSDHPAPAQPAQSCDHPDPSRFGRQFAQGAIEVLSGRRPMVQLTRHVSPAVQRGLVRAGSTHPLASTTTPLLHSLHLSQPAEGVCEMSAIVVVGPRYRALAARLEWKVDRWRCTALQVG